jgi:hypothetical protein
LSVITQLYFQIFEENHYMFRPFSGWTIISNVDIKNGGGVQPTQKRAETCSCFLQQFENTIVLRRTFVHLIFTNNCHSYLGQAQIQIVCMFWYCNIKVSWTIYTRFQFMLCRSIKIKLYCKYLRCCLWHIFHKSLSWAQLLVLWQPWHLRMCFLVGQYYKHKFFFYCTKVYG